MSDYTPTPEHIEAARRICAGYAPSPESDVMPMVDAILEVVGPLAYEQGKAARPPYSDAAIDKAYAKGQRDALTETDDLLIRCDSLLSLIRHREGVGLSEQTVRDLDDLLTVLRARAEQARLPKGAS